MSEESIKVLDCTLRDGGYIIDWNFGEGNIYSIITELSKSGIDFIECGYLKKDVYDKNKAFFNSFDEIIKNVPSKCNYTLMLNCEEWDFSDFHKCQNKNLRIRLAFKKYSQQKALKSIKQLKNLDWDIFVNPMNTNIYSEEELDELVEEINKIKPYAFFIVDTFGNMTEYDTEKTAKFIDKRLNSDIFLGLHSHNSMNLALPNAQKFLNTDTKRTLIIDSCLDGMGRGAGNLKTEEITEYINKQFNKKYDVNCLKNTTSSYINNLCKNSSWGFSVPYYVAAKYNCHPNYAKYLIEQKLSDKDIERIISKIPADKRIYYNKEFIKNTN